MKMDQEQIKQIIPHRDPFLLIDEIVEIEERYTLLYIGHTGNDVIRSGRAAPQLIHLLCSSFVHGFFEFVRHDMPKDEALTYIEQLQTFFACGWDQLFRP